MTAAPACPIAVPADVREVLDRFSGAGFEAFCVGGCVRDALRGREPHDWDLCTSARPEETLALFSDFRCIETGRKHGTVTVLTAFRPLEITTYRVDGAYTDHRRPEAVCFSSSLHEDCARRDFTVNAMAYRPGDGLRDFFGGREDLAAGIVRCVGNPGTRFDEDALRILRALRFASVLGYRIEEETAHALREKRMLLRFIAAERILQEFLRLLGGCRAAELLTDFAEVCTVFLPPCEALTKPLCASALAEAFCREEDPLRRLAALLCLCGVSAEDSSVLLHRLTMDNASLRRVCAMLKAETLPLPETRRELLGFLSDHSPEAAADAFALRRMVHPADADAILRAQTLCMELLQTGIPCTVSMLAVRGTALTALGFRGAEVGACLTMLLNRVMDGTLANTPDALLNAARAWKQAP